MRWKLRLDTGLRPDITVALRMDAENRQPLGYYLLPHIDITAAKIRLARRPRSSGCWPALIASVGITMPAEAQESAIPDFTSTNFGWLVNSGFDFLPIKGKVAPVGPDPNWRGGFGLPKADFNYQPPDVRATRPAECRTSLPACRAAGTDGGSSRARPRHA